MDNAGEALVIDDAVDFRGVLQRQIAFFAIADVADRDDDGADHTVGTGDGLGADFHPAAFGGVEPADQILLKRDRLAAEGAGKREFLMEQDAGGGGIEKLKVFGQVDGREFLSGIGGEQNRGRGGVREKNAELRTQDEDSVRKRVQNGQIRTI